MTSARTAYSARWVLPVASSPVEHGVVEVEGQRIVFVGTQAEFVSRCASDTRSAAARVVSLGNAVLMPGLVNAHTHLELTAMRGFLEGLPFKEWLRTLTAARTELLTGDALLDSARHGIGEALRNGITTCADTGDSGAPLQAMREAGVRGIGYVECFGPDPLQCDASLARLAERTAAFRSHDTALVRTGVSPHAPYTVSAPLLGAVATHAIREALPLAIHVAESDDESRFVRDGEGAFADGLRARGIAVAPQARSPIALLESCGVLAARPLLIHAIHADERDVAAIAASGAGVAHCPISNAKLGHGVAPVQDFRDAGVSVGLGTDSVASNDRMDLLGEARVATLFASLVAGAPDALSPHEALALATVGGARALGLDQHIGTLEPGKYADLSVFSLDTPDAGPVHDPAVTLVHVLAGATTARLVMVAGRELVRDGVVLDMDGSLAGRMSLLGEQMRRWRDARIAHGWRAG